MPSGMPAGTRPPSPPTSPTSPRPQAMIAGIRQRFGRLDTLVLNASGGLESGAEPAYAMRLNRDAQRRLVELALPMMPAGSRVVFVTSHQAHFYPHKAVPMGYAPDRGEHAGRGNRDVRHAVRIPPAGNPFHRGLGRHDRRHRRSHPVCTARRWSRAGTRRYRRPIEFAAAIAGAAQSQFHPGIVYVGGSEYLRTALIGCGGPGPHGCRPQAGQRDAAEPHQHHRQHQELGVPAERVVGCSPAASGPNAVPSDRAATSPPNRPPKLRRPK